MITATQTPTRPPIDDVLERFAEGRAAKTDIAALHARALELGMSRVRVTIRRTKPPLRGVVKLLGKSGPLSGSDWDPVRLGRQLYSAWWRTADLGIWLRDHPEVTRG